MIRQYLLNTNVLKCYRVYFAIFETKQDPNLKGIRSIRGLKLFFLLAEAKVGLSWFKKPK